MYSNKRLQNGCFNGKFPNFLSKLNFEILMDGCSKNLSKIFSKTPMDASEWMKKKHTGMSR